MLIGETLGRAFHRAKVTGTLILVACGLYLRAQQVEKPQKQHTPSLAETIIFMDRSVKPELSSVSSANACEVYVARNKRYTFALPKGQTIKSTDQFGVPHYTINWLFVLEPEVIRFNFSTIEPSSIKSSSLPSPQFIKEHDLDESTSDRKLTDLSVVFFDTTNSTDSIETGHLSVSSRGSNAKAVFDHQSSSGFIVFESKDRAERFVTAFVHAVELCGGKSSDFAPTPSKP